MNDEIMDELGPIDYVVVEFPAGKADFSGAIAKKWDRTTRSLWLPRKKCAYIPTSCGS